MQEDIGTPTRRDGAGELSGAGEGRTSPGIDRVPLGEPGIPVTSCAYAEGVVLTALLICCASAQIVKRLYIRRFAQWL